MVEYFIGKQFTAFKGKRMSLSGGPWHLVFWLFSAGLSTVLSSHRRRKVNTDGNISLPLCSEQPSNMAHTKPESSVSYSPLNRNKAKVGQLFKRSVHHTTLICIPEFLCQVQKYVILSMENTYTGVEGWDGHKGANHLISQHLCQDGVWREARQCQCHQWKLLQKAMTMMATCQVGRKLARLPCSHCSSASLAKKSRA